MGRCISCGGPVSGGLLCSYCAEEQPATPDSLRRDAQRRRPRKTGIPLDSSEQKVSLSREYGVPYIDLKDFHIAPEVISLVPEEIARALHLVPVNQAGGSIIIATYDPANVDAIRRLREVTGYDVEMVVSTRGEIETAIRRYYGAT